MTTFAFHNSQGFLFLFILYKLKILNKKVNDLHNTTFAFHITFADGGGPVLGVCLGAVGRWRRCRRVRRLVGRQCRRVRRLVSRLRRKPCPLPGRHPSLYFEYFELRTDSGFFWPSYLTENNNSGSQSNKKDCIVTSQYASQYTPCISGFRTRILTLLWLYFNSTIFDWFRVKVELK